MRTYLPSIIFPNVGNLGLPLILSSFGPQGLGYAIAFFTTITLAQFTLGQGIAAGTSSWRIIAKMPIIYAVALGVALEWSGIALPEWVGNTLSLIAGITVPIMLLMLGVALARLKVLDFRRAISISLLRIVMGLAVGVAVTFLLHLTGVARAVVILQAAMPVAVYNYLFAERFDNQPEEVAGLVVVSTLISVVSIPLLLDFLLLA